MRIRAARAGDLPRLVEIERAAGETFRALGMDLVADDDPGSVEELEVYADDGRAFVAVDEEDVPVGYLLLDELDGGAHVEQVSVDPRHARRGIGRTLIDSAAAWAEARSLRALTLTTYVEVPWNGPYYERLGFRYLEPAEETPALREIRAHERAHGLDAWPRASMLLELGGAEREDRLRLASSFGAAASAYAEHRPGYPHAAVRWALELAPGPRVLDLGAGTGKLTATLVALGIDVVAVEPDPVMLSELRRSAPTVQALPGSAEAIPLPDASVDAVVAGNAMHWFDMSLAGPEIARALRPNGVLAGLWNVFDDRVEWVAELERIGGSAAVGPRDTLRNWRAATAEAHLPSDGSVPRFGSPEQAEFPHGQRRTADSLAATLATKAGMLVMPEQEREDTLDRIRAFLASRPETARGEFVLPMLTGVLRTRRL